MADAPSATLYAGPVRELPAWAIILAMTSRPTTSKVLLVADGRVAAAGDGATPIRRYRIARIRPENRPTTGGSGSEHASH
jgi:hypothetical protein